MMTRMLGLTPVAWASDALEKSADAAIRSGVRLRMAFRFNVAILRETWTKRGLRGDLDESTATALAHGLRRLWGIFD